MGRDADGESESSRAVVSSAEACSPPGSAITVAEETGTGIETEVEVVVEDISSSTPILS